MKLSYLTLGLFALGLSFADTAEAYAIVADGGPCEPSNPKCVACWLVATATGSYDEPPSTEGGGYPIGPIPKPNGGHDQALWIIVCIA